MRGREWSTIYIQVYFKIPFDFILFYVYECVVCICLYTTFMPCAHGIRRGHWISETGVMGGCEPSRGC